MDGIVPGVPSRTQSRGMGVGSRHEGPDGSSPGPSGPFAVTLMSQMAQKVSQMAQAKIRPGPHVVSRRPFPVTVS